MHVFFGYLLAIKATYSFLIKFLILGGRKLNKLCFRFLEIYPASGEVVSCVAFVYDFVRVACQLRNWFVIKHEIKYSIVKWRERRRKRKKLHTKVK